MENGRSRRHNLTFLIVGIYCLWWIKNDIEKVSLCLMYVIGLLILHGFSYVRDMREK